MNNPENDLMGGEVRLKRGSPPFQPMRRIVRTPSITREIVDEIVTNQIKSINISTEPNQGGITKEDVEKLIDNRYQQFDNQIALLRNDMMKTSENVSIQPTIQEPDNKINIQFTDEEPVKLLAVNISQEEAGAFTVKLYLNIFVNDDKNVCSKYVECIWSGIKKVDDEYFITSAELMFSTPSIKSSSLNLDIGNVQFSTSYNQLYTIIDILPTIKGSKMGTIKGYYEIIKQNDNINILNNNI